MNSTASLVAQPQTPEVYERLAPLFDGIVPGMNVVGTEREQSRARYPDAEGFLERDGVRVFWESYGAGQPAVLLLPTWMLIHSRHWKMQIPFLARQRRVVTFDPRGNGRSDRPDAVGAYDGRHTVDDALAVLDELGIERAVVVGFSAGAAPALVLAAEHPERVAGAVFIGPSLPLGAAHPERSVAFAHFWEPFDRTDGWFKNNASYWRHDYADFARYFFGQFFSEPHSTKGYEDAVGWALETTGETLATEAASDGIVETEDRAEALARDVTCPTLVIHGTGDRISPVARGRRLAELTSGRLALLEGSGHGPHVRDPVKVNELLREFLELVDGLAAPAGAARRPGAGAAPGAGVASGAGGPPWTRAMSRRRRRVLYISSPIGLGHAQRDLAIARELRRLDSDLEVDWLAQHPVTQFLLSSGERIHPASGLLASESRHIESESGEHDLHAFQAIRRMDEILVANFMVFRDIVRDDPYDLWIGDESWELDYYLHENPELKTAAYVWLTDFVGWLPMPEGGETEATLTADYNAEMIEHIERFPRVRDRAIFVGNPADIVPDRFGPGLPLIRDWTERHYAFSGHITGFDPIPLDQRPALRDELGYRPDEQVCIVSVGGSGVGGNLLRKVMAAFPEARRRVPNLRMVVVAGPRIDPATLPPAQPGLEVRTYVHELYRHFAACDLAIVQGGLTTTMELTANRRPFIYFPLRRHFEQTFHVRHRLERYDAGVPMSFDEASPDVLADAIAAHIGTTPPYRPVERDGAKRAAQLIAPLL
jgi:pimeloyl-ACP methyl ester carboxylesterase/predicted glycosyltransferase